MDAANATVFVIDADPISRDNTSALVLSLAFNCELFSSTIEFFATANIPQSGCVIVDCDLEGRNALQIQPRLMQVGSDLCIVFLGKNLTVPDVVHVMQEGAISVIEKPYNAEELAATICRAVEISSSASDVHHRLDLLRSRVQRLSSRERSVMSEIIAGTPNKTIARKLGVCHRTAAQIRATVFEKMGVESAVDLAILTGELRKFDREKAEDARVAPSGVVFHTAGCHFDIASRASYAG
jgi:FixJ family two-component response regulator